MHSYPFPFFIHPNSDGLGNLIPDSEVRKLWGVYPQQYLLGYATVLGTNEVIGVSLHFSLLEMVGVFLHVAHS